MPSKRDRPGALASQVDQRPRTSTKHDVLLELAVCCLALVAAGTITTTDALPGLLVFFAFLGTVAIAAGTAALACYELVTSDAE